MRPNRPPAGRETDWTITNGQIQSSGIGNILVHKKQDADKQYKNTTYYVLNTTITHIHMADHYSGFPHVL